MELFKWTTLFREKLNELGFDCSELYAAGHYGEDRDPAATAERVASYGVGVGGVIWPTTASG